MFFDGYHDIARVLVTGTLAYIGLVLLLRVSGKRTLSKFNAFDFIITIAFGSALSATILDYSVSLSEGLAALALLVALQYLTTWLSVRSEKFQTIVKAQPSLLYNRGEFLRRNMRKERVTHEEVLAAIREHGSPVSEVAAAIMETDGTISILTKPGGEGAAEKRETLKNVRS